MAASILKRGEVQRVSTEHADSCTGGNAHKGPHVDLTDWLSGAAENQLLLEALMRAPSRGCAVLSQVHCQTSGCT